jgi:murein L,D-transpeptidase YcbB/YkuD
MLLGPDWNQDKIAATLDTKKTKTVMMPTPLPILLMYWTAIVNESGEVYFYNDVYQRDQKISDALDEPFTFDLPTT